MSTTPQYASTPVAGNALLTTADTSTTAPSTVGTVLTAGANGSRIDQILITSTASPSQGLVNLFVFDGTTYHLWQQVPIQAVTQNTTSPGYQAALSTNANANILPLTLPNGYSLRATTSVTQAGIKVLAFGGNF